MVPRAKHEEPWLKTVRYFFFSLFSAIFPTATARFCFEEEEAAWQFIKWALPGDVGFDVTILSFFFSSQFLPSFGQSGVALSFFSSS